MSENLFGLTVATDKGLDDLQCQRLLSENRRYQEVMLQYRCALKALESRLEILNEEFSCFSVLCSHFCFSHSCSLIPVYAGTDDLRQHKCLSI